MTDSTPPRTLRDELKRAVHVERWESLGDIGEAAEETE